jgi:uncharacterized membrane protein YdbT with pleckstrin-like domain
MPAKPDYLIPGESVVLYTHQHIFILAKAALINVVSFALLIWIAYVSGSYTVLLIYVAPLFYLLWKIALRMRKTYLVTDRRVVAREGLLAVSSIDAALDKINNVFHEQSAGGRIFGYGNVRLETASEQGILLCEFIPSPLRFKNAVLHQRELRRTVSAGRADEASRMNVPKMLEELASLRDRGIISAAEFEEKKKKLLASL